MDTTDIAVIGGGPAGTSFARLAGGRYRVTVLDRRGLSSPPAGVGKCCGGLLSPDAQHSLAALGLNLPLDVLVDPQIFAVRTMDLQMETERYYQRPYVNMNRERFDRWLASLLPSSVRMLDRAVCRDIHREGEGFSIAYRRGGEDGVLHARAVVGARTEATLWSAAAFFPTAPSDGMWRCRNGMRRTANPPFTAPFSTGS